MIAPILFLGALGGAIYLAVKGPKRIVPDPNADNGTTSGKGRYPIRPTPSTLPFKLGVNAAGNSELDITDAAGMYAWVVQTAIANGAKADSNGGDVLRKVVAAIPGLGDQELVGFKLSELGPPNDDEVDDFVRAASEMTWATALAKAKAWMEGQGLA